jgi:hypothetical protein
MSIRSTLFAAAAVALLSLAAAGTASAAGSTSSCFLANQWSAWHAPNPNVIYLRVNSNRIYRLDLSAGSSSLQDPGVHLVSRIEGSDWICSPLDLQLEVADDMGGLREGLIVKSITLLTPDEVKAIPKRDLP